MTKKERIARVYARASEMGLSYSETSTLVKIQRTLHRWAELECGTEGRHGSSHSIERDEATGKPMYRVQYLMAGGGWHDTSHPVADREAGALRRLANLMIPHPTLVYYHQTDPRGCSLYVVRRSDIRDGEKLDSVYTRGLAMEI